MEFQFTNFSTVKPKTVVFAKKKKRKSVLLKKIINEMDPMEFVSVKLKFLSATNQSELS